MPLDEFGVTPSEKYLGKLCHRSFLNLWSYPNLFRDQGRKCGKGDGKELCDLTIIFGNNIILFSDKSCVYKNTGQPKLDWEKWFRKAIVKSVDQLIGAERWLKDNPEKVFRDRKCTQSIKIGLPAGPDVRYHKIVVALGAKDECKKHFNGGSGSLLVDSSIKGREQHTQPFIVGQALPAKGYIHVFDDVTLDIVMSELDTIADFVNYLIKKEELLTRKNVIACGEEEMLANYLKNYDSAGSEHTFGVPEEAEGVYFDEGSWSWVKHRTEYIDKKQLDQVSYLWDRIINNFSKHLLNGTLREGTTDIAKVEPGLRLLASESRMARRFLSNSFIEVRNKTTIGLMQMRYIKAFADPSTAYVFMFAHYDNNNYENYRKRRAAYVQDYSFLVAHLNRQYKRVIGIAAEGRDSEDISLDMCCIEVKEWTTELIADAQRIQDVHGWLRPENIRQGSRTDYEFPPPRLTVREKHNVGAGGIKIGRNDLCFCGSMKKFKRCCMRR